MNHTTKVIFHCPFSSLQSLSHVRLFVTPWTATCQASLFFTISQSLLKPVSIEVMPSNHLILCHPLLLPSVLPSIRVFAMSWFFASSGQSIGASASASASVLPMNIQGRFHLGLTGWISLQSKGLSRVFFNTTVQFKGINSSALSLLYGPTLTSIYDHWKNHSFDYMDFCWQSDVSAL